MHETAHLALSNDQLWVFLIGTIVPLGGYVLNRLGPWASETVKAAVHVALAAIAAGLYTALETKVFGVNTQTLELVVTAVVAALGAHHWLWKPATVNTKLGT